MPCVTFKETVHGRLRSSVGACKTSISLVPGCCFENPKNSKRKGATPSS